MYTPAETQKYSVQYQHHSGGIMTIFDLTVNYLQNATVAIHLLAEQKHNGIWKVLSATIDEDATTAAPEEALADIAELRWYIFPAKEQRRETLPTVGVWRMNKVIIAACLPDRYSQERRSLKDQIKQPSAERRLCWWPDLEAWTLAEQIVSHSKQASAGAIEIKYFSFSEWLTSPDVAKQMKEIFDTMSEEEDDPEHLQTLQTHMYAFMYSRYLRNMRTMLLYLKKREIAAKIVLGETKNEMPDFFIEEIPQTSSLGVAGKIRAVVSLHSIWPGTNTGADMIGAAIYAGDTHVSDLLLWLNPLVDGCEEKAIEPLLQKITTKWEIQKIIMAQNTLPFEICPHCRQVRLPGRPDKQSAKNVKEIAND
ncbi:hypothetical protein CEB3_c05160 [Peptococcaceae bacterium CEB3]|nr:hypothetical protein CEB3_c05160 [Peptococcaceae bacterium CEB3]